MADPRGMVRRRRSLVLDEAEEVPSDDEPDDDEVKAIGVGSKLAAKFAASTTKAKGKEEVGPSGQTYTPLEKQFKEIKSSNPDVLLLMEVGYKYKYVSRMNKLM
jgi:DNA mismatch repair protein MSH3